MRKEKTLVTLFRGIVELLEDESARNPEFAVKLEALLTELPVRKIASKNVTIDVVAKSDELPDIYAELKSRGESEFKFWLKDQPVHVLRALIKHQDFDPIRRAAKWKDTEKLAAFIADSLRARMERGLAFFQQRSEIESESGGSGA